MAKINSKGGSGGRETKSGKASQSAGKRKSASGSSKGSASKQLSINDTLHNRTVSGTVLFIVGIVLLFVAYFRGAEGTVWHTVHYHYYSLFGFSGTLVPMIFLVSGVLVLLNRFNKKVVRITAGVFIAFLLVSGICYVAKLEKGAVIDLGEELQRQFDVIDKSGRGHFNAGGVAGAIPGGLLYKTVGRKFLPLLVFVLLIIADVMILIGKNLRQIAEKLEPYAKDGYDRAKGDLENKKEDYRERRNERKRVKLSDGEDGGNEEEPRARREKSGGEDAGRNLFGGDEEKLERSRKQKRQQIDAYGRGSRNEAPRVIPQFDPNEIVNGRDAAAQADGKPGKKVNSDGEKVSVTPITPPAGQTENSPEKLAEIQNIFSSENAKRGGEPPIIPVSQAYVHTEAKSVSEASAAPLTGEQLSFSSDSSDLPHIERPGNVWMDNDVPEQTGEGETPPEKLPSLSVDEQQEVNDEIDEAMNAVPEKFYEKPSLDLLRQPDARGRMYDEKELRATGDKLIASLKSFNVEATVMNIVPGPTVTRYELKPGDGVKIAKFTNLSDDLALHLSAPAGLRIEAPIPGKPAIGVEVPNSARTSITFRECIDNEKFENSKSKLNVALGKNISGDIIYCDIAKMPHLLVAGTTGSGKSVCMNTMIMSILYHATPDEVKIILIDPKQVEFGMYSGIPHLLVPVVTDPRKASGALGWAVTEMLSRYKTLNANGVRDINAYNALCDDTNAMITDESEKMKKMPRVVIFIDELSDLMAVAPAEVEDSIQRLAQMARAAGMHLVLATQRPSVDVITGVIKANIPSRIALTVKSQIDSRTMIDSAGAEKLMGNGDMLYFPVGEPRPIRVQGSYLSDKEIEGVVEFLKQDFEAKYDESVMEGIEKNAAVDKRTQASAPSAEGGAASSADEEIINKALELIVDNPDLASVSAFQRKLSLGFSKAGKIMDILEERGFVGPKEGSKPRKVLMTKTQFYEMLASSASGAALDNGGGE